jgi:hypothetical protein
MMYGMMLKATKNDHLKLPRTDTNVKITETV